MADAEQERPRVPAALKKLVRGYLNTCRAMSRLWRRGTVVLLLAAPAAFLGAGYSGLDAAISGVGLTIALSAIGRFLVFEFRQFRAGRVARRIERRIPPSHPSYDAVIEWIAEHNDGNYLNSVLKQLGVSPRKVSAYATPLPESVAPPVGRVQEKVQEFAEKLLAGRGSDTQTGQVQTHVFTSSQTLVLNEDGEWVTVHSETSDDGEPIVATEAMQKALEVMAAGYADTDIPERTAEPPADFVPIPVGSPAAGATRTKDDAPAGSKRHERRRGHMPLQFENYRAHDDGEDREEVGSASSPAEDER